MFSFGHTCSLSELYDFAVIYYQWICFYCDVYYVLVSGVLTRSYFYPERGHVGAAAVVVIAVAGVGDDGVVASGASVAVASVDGDAIAGVVCTGAVGADDGGDAVGVAVADADVVTVGDDAVVATVSDASDVGESGVGDDEGGVGAVVQGLCWMTQGGDVGMEEEGVSELMKARGQKEEEVACGSVAEVVAEEVSVVVWPIVVAAEVAYGQQMVLWQEFELHWYAPEHDWPVVVGLPGQLHKTEVVKINPERSLFLHLQPQSFC